ncbi:MAG: 4Fe-4S dicluster domain-containing protein [Halobacteriota archaeon]
MKTGAKESEKEVLSSESSTFEFLYNKDNLIKCLQCGRCTAGCPAAKVFDDYSPREIVRRAQECSADELAKDPLIWRCGQCYTCNSRCPRNNTPASIILNARNKAFKEGYAPNEIYEKASFLFQSLESSGVTVSPKLFTHDLGLLSKLVDHDKITTLRAELGLPPQNARDIPVPTKALNEIRMILKLTCNKGGLFNDH